MVVGRGGAQRVDSDRHSPETLALKTETTNDRSAPAEVARTPRVQPAALLLATVVLCVLGYVAFSRAPWSTASFLGMVALLVGFLASTIGWMRSLWYWGAYRLRQRAAAVGLYVVSLALWSVLVAPMVVSLLYPGA